MSNDAMNLTSINNELLKKINSSKNIPEWFDRVRLGMRNCKKIIRPAEFDRLNAMFISKTVIDDTHDNISLIHQYGSAVLHWTVLNTVLCTYEEDYCDPSAGILNRLSKNDLFLVDGKLVRFSDFDREKKLISFSEKGKGKSGPCLNVLPVDVLKGRIQLYSGSATKERTFSGKPAIPTVGHPLFSAIYQIEAEDICPKTSMVVVTQKKDYVEQLRNLVVYCKTKERGEVEEDFCRAVPTVLQSNATKESKILPIRDNRPAMLRVVSDLSIALEVVKANTNIDTLIVDGESKLVSRIWELKQFLEMPHLNNKILLLSSQIGDELLAKIKEIGFVMWVWDSDSVKTLCGEGLKVEKQEEKIASDDPFLIQEKMLRNTVSFHREIIKVPYPDADVKKHMRRLTKALWHLRGKAEHPVYGEAIADLILQTYRFRSELLSPLYNMPRQEIDEKEHKHPADANAIQELCQILTRNVFDTDTNSTIDEISKNVKILELSFRAKGNLKSRLLADYLSTLKVESAVILRRARDAQAAEKKYAQGIKNSRFLSLSDMRGLVDVQNVVFTGWLGNSHTSWIDRPVSTRQTYFLYDIEEDIFTVSENKRTRTSLRFSSVEEKANLLGISSSECEQLFNSNGKQSVSRNIDDEMLREDNLKGLIDKLWLKGEIPIFGGEREHINQVEAKYVVFDDDYGGFFTERYKAKVLDRTAGRVLSKNIDSLVCGEELLFLKDDRRDLFDAVVDIAEAQNPGLREKASIWKKALEKLKKEKNIDDVQLTALLNQEGLTAEVITVRNWFDEDLIAPHDCGKLIVILAKLLGNPDLLRQGHDIRKACSKLRALHVFVGKYLAKQIIGSFSEPLKAQKVSSGLLLENLKDLKNHVQIVQIVHIAHETKMAPYNMVNRLLEK